MNMKKKKPPMPKTKMLGKGKLVAPAKSPKANKPGTAKTPMPMGKTIFGKTNDGDMKGDKKSRKKRLEGMRL